MNALTDTGVTITLKIEKLVHGGSGLARHGGRACFVDGVAPGETVLARISDNRGQYLRADLCEVLEPSASRLQPPCPAAGVCGGCQWQHLTYDAQLSSKADILRDCLVRIAKLPGLTPQPPAPSPLQLRYRSRAALKISGGNKPAMGFYRNRSHTVVEACDCLLLEPYLCRAAEMCRGTIRQNTSYSGFTDLELLAVGGTPLVLGLWQDRAGRHKLPFSVDAESGRIGPPGEPPWEMLSNIAYLRTPENFYQVNRLQNLALIGRVLDYFAPAAGRSVLDLFCGCGNFSLFLARAGARVLGIDSNGTSIAQARKNARKNGISGARFMHGDAGMLKNSALGESYDAVLINPPRAGCEARTLENIAACGPSDIVYVSCDPATLARDLRILHASGYEILEIQPFDMFPQTHHLESVVKLHRTRPHMP